MPFNAFVNFGDIKGESTDANHKDWIEVTSYRQPITRAVSAAGRSGPAVSEITITKRVDAASPKLYEAVHNGTHLKEAVIELVHAGGKTPFLVIKLTDVVITSALDDAETTGAAQFPSETISLTYGKIQWTYTRQKPDGTAADTVAAEWDLRAQTAA